MRRRLLLRFECTFIFSGFYWFTVFKFEAYGFLKRARKLFHNFYKLEFFIKLV